MYRQLWFLEGTGEEWMVLIKVPHRILANADFRIFCLFSEELKDRNLKGKKAGAELYNMANHSLI